MEWNGVKKRNGMEWNGMSWSTVNTVWYTCNISVVKSRDGVYVEFPESNSEFNSIGKLPEIF